MFKYLLTISITAIFILGGAKLALNYSNSPLSGVSFKDIKIPELNDLPIVLVPEASLDFGKKKHNTIKLERRNTLVLNDVITWKSISKLQAKLIDMDNRLPKNVPIYLVLDTPGGSVDFGMQFIDTAKALDRKIKTITLFAASMGFHIVQNMDTRYVMTSSTLMSHRARIGGLGGQLDGELETRYNSIMRVIQYMDYIAATRMKLSVKDYKKLILNEYWVNGFDAVKDKAADKQVLVKCGKSLTGDYIKKVDTFLGPVKVRYSRCPLVRAPLEVMVKNVAIKKQVFIEELFKMKSERPEVFVKKYIINNKFKRYFK